MLRDTCVFHLCGLWVVLLRCRLLSRCYHCYLCACVARVRLLLTDRPEQGRRRLSGNGGQEEEDHICSSPTRLFDIFMIENSVQNKYFELSACWVPRFHGSSICNLNFSHFFKWILKILTKIRCSVKKKSPLLFPARANLQLKDLFCSKMCICFHYASLNFHIFSNVFIKYSQI